MVEKNTHKHAHREPHVHNQEDTTASLAVYLEGLGLEAGGLPEDTDHLSTMLVIEEKGQIPKRFLGRVKTQIRLHMGTLEPPPWTQLHLKSPPQAR